LAKYAKLIPHYIILHISQWFIIQVYVLFMSCGYVM